MVGSGSGISKQNLLIAFIKKEVGSGIRFRDGAMVGSGSGIKHPGSATLTASNKTFFLLKSLLKGQCHAMAVEMGPWSDRRDMPTVAPNH
jgi:hypothetical protein